MEDTSHYPVDADYYFLPSIDRRVSIGPFWNAFWVWSMHGSGIWITAIDPTSTYTQAWSTYAYASGPGSYIFQREKKAVTYSI